MTREELNKLEIGQIVKAYEFPYTAGSLGEIVDWEVIQVYPANLDNPHHMGRVLITRQEGVHKYTEFLTHNSINPR